MQHMLLTRLSESLFESHCCLISTSHLLVEVVFNCHLLWLLWTESSGFTFFPQVQIDPYLEDSMCQVCLRQPGPFFCRDQVSGNLFQQVFVLLAVGIDDADGQSTITVASSLSYLLWTRLGTINKHQNFMAEFEICWTLSVPVNQRSKLVSVLPQRLGRIAILISKNSLFSLRLASGTMILKFNKMDNKVSLVHWCDKIESFTAF